jgi:hypothetical protein
MVEIDKPPMTAIERLLQFRSGAKAQRRRQQLEQRTQRCHQNRPEPDGSPVCP